MTKTHLFTYLVFCALFGAGILVTGFFGGFMAGMAITLLLLVSVGRRQAARAGERIDQTHRRRAAAQEGGDDGD